MKITEFTGATEKNGILVTSPTQAIVIDMDAALTAGAQSSIEMSIVDFTNGRETRIVKKTPLWKMLHPLALNQLNPSKSRVVIEIADDVNEKLNAQRVLRINLSNLSSAVTFGIYALPANKDGNATIIYETIAISAGITQQKFPINFKGQLLFPETDLDTVRLLWSNGKEQILSVTELKMLRDLAISNAWGPDQILIDTFDEVSGAILTQVDVTLANPNAYEILKCISFNNPSIKNIIQ